MFSRLACQARTGVPVLFDEGDEVLDGLEAGAFRAVAPAAQVLGSVAGVLVVEGLEVLSPPQCPGGRELGRGPHQLVQLALLLGREVRPGRPVERALRCFQWVT